LFSEGVAESAGTQSAAPAVARAMHGIAPTPEIGSTKSTATKSGATTQGLSLRGALLSRGESTGAHAALDPFLQLKNRIHIRLIESLDITALMSIDGNDELEAAIERTIHVLLAEEKVPITQAEKDRIARDVLYETLGLGPLEPLLADPNINDI